MKPENLGENDVKVTTSTMKHLCEMPEFQEAMAADEGEFPETFSVIRVTWVPYMQALLLIHQNSGKS